MDMSYGTLTVRTYVAEESVPIEGAVITVTGAGEENGDILFSVITDEDGVTEKITLPAPDVKYSLSPASPEISYSLYDVSVVREDYYTKKLRNVAIFSGVDAVLPVNMIPYVTYSDGGSYPRGNINATIRENEMLE